MGEIISFKSKKEKIELLRQLETLFVIRNILNGESTRNTKDLIHFGDIYQYSIRENRRFRNEELEQKIIINNKVKDYILLLKKQLSPDILKEGIIVNIRDLEILAEIKEWEKFL